MFGDPTWFRPKDFGWGLVPVTWEGWAYTGGWVSVLLVPFFGLFFSGRFIEGLVWLAMSMGVLIYDVHLILCAMHAPPETAPAVESASDEEAPADDRKYDFYIQ